MTRKTQTSRSGYIRAPERREDCAAELILKRTGEICDVVPPYMGCREASHQKDMDDDRAEGNAGR